MLCPFATQKMTDEEERITNEMYPNRIENYFARLIAKPMVDNAVKEILKEQEHYNELHKMAHKMENK
jgi:hypothetical protein